MVILSLFDGMSCGQIALNRAGIYYSHYFASEIDKYAIKVTQHNYPNTIQLGGVEQVSVKKDGIYTGGDSLISDKIPDLFIGGSPCQGFSFAGKQLNFNDPRSVLFFEYVRILKEIRKYNPNVLFLLENVRMKKEYRDIISQQLGVEPIEINSAVVSAHNRNRLYWTNLPESDLKDKKILLSDIIEDGYVDRDKSLCLDANYWKGCSLDRYLYKSKRQIVFIDNKNNWRKLTPLECERLQTVTDYYTATVSNSQRYKMLGNGWTVDIIAEAFFKHLDLYV